MDLNCTSVYCRLKGEYSDIKPTYSTSKMDLTNIELREASACYTHILNLVIRVYNLFAIL